MEKEKKALGQLPPEENEKFVDELESEMRKSGAEFEESGEVFSEDAGTISVSQSVPTAIYAPVYILL